MKHIKNTLVFLLSSLLLVGCAKEMSKEIISNLEDKEDGISYATNITKDYRIPDLKADGEDDEDEQIGDVDKIILHYVNDDNNCATRAFYIWVNGVDGTEYSLKEDSDIVQYAADGSMMTITMDLKNDARFAELAEAKASSIMYIIKFQMISASNLNWGGQSEDVELKYSDFPPVNGVVEVWCTPAAGGGIAQFATEEETKVDGVKLANFTDYKTISCSLTPTAGTVEWELYAFDETYYKVKSKNRAAIKKNYLIKTGTTSSKSFTIPLKYNAHMNVVYSIVSKDVDSITGLTKTVFVSFEQLYYTTRFEQKYTYKPAVNDLGFTYTEDYTIFKVWSPVAANITLLVYDSDTSAAYNGSDKYKGYHMLYQPNGVWALKLLGNLEGKYYNYQVDTWAGNSVSMDPYATGAGACGLRGLIYDKNSALVTPEGWADVDNNISNISTPQELSIYEVHIQDFTGDSSWVSNHNNARGTYNAFVEEGTTVTANDINGTSRTVSTGFDHLKELGVKAVQLMPVFDSDNDEVKNKKYNWGYNPQNYNCVEGVYSSDPHNGYARIKEFKNLVARCAENDMRVIMDVVYNHVSSVSSSPFNKLMPRYFFRYAQEGEEDVTKGWIGVGELYDGSGCHNEFKSEATMARKYIVDSVSMWAKEYKIKGFRFDLMGLLDVETMRAIKRAVYKIDSEIYLYGEGWTSGGFHGKWDQENHIWSQGAFCCNGLGNQVYSALFNGNHNNHETYPIDIDDTNSCYLGGFNDLGRNATKGGNDMGWGSETHLPGYGWISQGSDSASANNRVSIEKMIWGGHANINDTIGLNPKQTVNYASCHDNWTLRDQLYQCLGDGTKPGNGYDIMHASETVHALIFTSNAAAFMLGGEEILRTKDVDLANPALVADNTIPRDSYENMYGHLTSHNSYNSPIEVNSFKWTNKIVATFDEGKSNGESINSYKVDTYGEGLTNKFARMIELHNTMPKYDMEKVHARQVVTSKGIYVDNLSWSGVTGEGSFGIQFDEYFIYASGRSFGKVGAGSVPRWGAPLLTVGGNVEYHDGSLNLGNEVYGNGFAFAIYYAGGKR